MKQLALLVAFGCYATLSYGQGFVGRITDLLSGNPLPFASIYVQETGSGTVTNENGDYQLRLPSGYYTLVFQYLGYSTEVKRVGATANFQPLNLALRPEALELSTIEVLDGKEDMSYSVIRRAIAKADYHRNQIDAYTAEVYVKGTGKIDKIPRLYLSMMSKEDRAEIDTTQAFISESISKISYQRPNTFRQEVVSIYERGDLGADATPYLFATFYQPKVAAAVSPLAPSAFGYYKFSHEGLFYDREYAVNKIKVIPRSKGEGVFEGYIYIVEGQWSIHSLDLRTYQTGFQFDIRQTYAPIQTTAWMPVTTKVDVQGKILGIAMRGHYISAVSNYDISINPNLPAYLEVIDEKTAPEQAQTVRKANQQREHTQILEEGGALTGKELRRLIRNYEKEERAQAEAPEILSDFTLTNDSAKTTVDTAYWAAVRPVPLTPLESRTYAIQDSVWSLSSQNRDSLQIAAALSLSGGDEESNINQVKKTFGNFSISPHLDLLNAVEGYTLGGQLSVRKLWKNQQLQLAVNPRYGFGWQKLMYKTDLSYNQSKAGKYFRASLSGGRYLRQFDARPAMDPLLNTFTMLFSHRNYLSWYERDYGQLALQHGWGRKLQLVGTFSYENRHLVENQTEAGLLFTESRTYRPNNPFNAAIGGVLQDLAPAATLKMQLRWEPKQRYTLQNGVKRRVKNTSPTWSLLYAAGLPGIGQSSADFHRLQAAYQRRFEAGIRGKIDLLIRGGTFLSNKQVDLPDFKHFATTEIFFTEVDPIAGYRLLPFYAFSTNSSYLETYAHYQFRKFLLSRIWRLQRLGLREDVFVNYLYTPESEHYTELGYSIDNIFRLFRLEFVSSFQDFQYRDFGIRLSAAAIFGRN